jgi:hypothetical protein
MTIHQGMVIHQHGNYSPRVAHPQDGELIEFDEGNEAELARHGISATEAFQSLQNEPVWVPNKKNRAGTWLALGQTSAGRALTIPVVYDEIRRTVRPITGWDSTTGETVRYLRGGN